MIEIKSFEEIYEAQSQIEQENFVVVYKPKVHNDINAVVEISEDRVRVVEGDKSFSDWVEINSKKLIQLAVAQQVISLYGHWQSLGNSYQATGNEEGNSCKATGNSNENSSLLPLPSCLLDNYPYFGVTLLLFQSEPIRAGRASGKVQTTARLFSDTKMLDRLVDSHRIPDVHIIPSHPEDFKICYSTPHSADFFKEKLITLTKPLKETNPWIKELYDIDRKSEYVYFYPSEMRIKSDFHNGTNFYEDLSIMTLSKFEELAFKF